MKQKLLNELHEAIKKPNGTKYELLLQNAMDYICDSGKYDFFVNFNFGYDLYLRLYNKNGEFFNNKLWLRAVDVTEILTILRNIIKFEL